MSCREQNNSTLAATGGDGRIATLEELFNKLDFDGNGTISWPEYEAMGKVLYGARWDPTTHMNEFRQMDTNRSGDIDKQDRRLMLTLILI